MGILSDFFGSPSDKQVDRDIERGQAEARNDAEEEAESQYVEEAAETGEDPLDNDGSK
ncbi:MAG: hypothetical protein UR98_C0031G0003 [Parcubacteria group bacterium GW2011_GWA1_36_12]|nr:MAG: hypothetical protein UR98_C0031G0003 [Parcubacteria group bacterium GW2011_GWA1_36_12]